MRVVPDSQRHLTRSIYLALMMTVISVLLLFMLWRLRTLLILLFVSLLIACSMAGPVNKLHKRGLKKGLVVVGLYLMVLAIIGIVGWFAVPALVGQASDLVDRVPDYVDRFTRLQNRLADIAVKYPALKGINKNIDTLAGRGGERVGQLVLDLPQLVAESILVVTSMLTLSLLMVVSWDKMKPGIIELIHPKNRELAARVMTEIGTRLGAYLRAKAIMMTIIGVWVYVTLLLLHVPFAVLISLIAALSEIVPRIGPLFGRLIIVLGAATAGWVPAVIAMISHIVIDEMKGSWLSPLIEGDQLDIHPMTALTAVLAGAILLGWKGALIAVPMAASIQVLFEQILVPWRKHQLAKDHEGPLLEVPPEADQPEHLPAE